MARKKERGDERPQPQPGGIDQRRAREEGAKPEELRAVNEGRGDGANPEWWKNEGGSGEVQ